MMELADIQDLGAVTSVKVFPAPVILSEAKNPFPFFCSPLLCN